MPLCSLINLNFTFLRLDCVLHSWQNLWLVNLLLPSWWLVMALMDMILKRLTKNVRWFSRFGYGNYGNALSVEVLDHMPLHVVQCSAHATRSTLQRMSTGLNVDAVQSSLRSIQTGITTDSISVQMSQFRSNSISRRLKALVMPVCAAGFKPAVRGVRTPNHEILREPAHHTTDPRRGQYVPMWTYFLNMYYLGGVSNCVKIFVCTDGWGSGGPMYLVNDPSLTCWSGKHVALLVPGILGLLLFLVGVPALYAYILFGVVRVRGREDPICKQHFSFLYYRFEPDYFVRLSRLNSVTI